MHHTVISIENLHNTSIQQVTMKCDEIKRLSNYCCWHNFERLLFSWQNRFLKIEFRKNRGIIRKIRLFVKIKQQVLFDNTIKVRSPSITDHNYRIICNIFQDRGKNYIINLLVEEQDSVSHGNDTRNNVFFPSSSVAIANR